MSHNINSHLLMKRKPSINIAIHTCTCCECMAFTYAHDRAPCKARVINEKVKSARNKHKNESFYAYENVMRL